MASLKINCSIEEILRGKFSDTIARINGYVAESRGDMENDTTYAARSVNGRMCRIQETFEEDLEKLIKDITLHEITS